MPPPTELCPFEQTSEPWRCAMAPDREPLRHLSGLGQDAQLAPTAVDGPLVAWDHGVEEGLVLGQAVETE
ncbi:hypothetical protein NKDENANG_03022 [Candidatus Entotheonellaceae bacterium PAL068K]